MVWQGMCPYGIGIGGLCSLGDTGIDCRRDKNRRFRRVGRKPLELGNPLSSHLNCLSERKGAYVCNLRGRHPIFLRRPSSHLGIPISLEWFHPETGDFPRKLFCKNCNQIDWLKDGQTKVSTTLTLLSICSNITGSAKKNVCKKYL